MIAHFLEINDLTLNGKIVWISGGSSGIGAALARATAQDGATVVLSARREDLLLQVRDSCKKPESHLVLPLDLLNPDAVSRAAAQVIEHLGQVDLLINNAGISQRSLAEETMLAVDRRIMDVNFFGTVILTKAVLPSMKQRRVGHIVVVSSLLGKFGAAKRSSYAASKHALHGFFDSLRLEVKDDRIQVTVICPGFVRTEASKNALTGDGQLHAIMDEDLERGMSPEKCAARILRAIRSRQREAYIGGSERWGVYLNRYAPRIFYRLMQNRPLK